MTILLREQIAKICAEGREIDCPYPEQRENEHPVYQGMREPWLRMADDIIGKITKRIEKAHLTGFTGEGMKEAAAHLEAHNLPTLFSYRESYFVGVDTQFDKILSLFKEQK